MLHMAVIKRRAGTLGLSLSLKGCFWGQETVFAKFCRVPTTARGIRGSKDDGMR